jgi:hypothetical protein
MDDRFIKLALDAGLLNYVDHETPRHYFINGHADLEDVAKFAELVILETRQEAADEIERLREALADLVAIQNGPPLVTYTEAWDAAMEKAYAALKEGE